jgi:hypothetical protein
MKIGPAGAIAASILFAWPAAGDDSSAQLKAGGIVFVNTTPLKMAEEDLYISPEKVRIRFVFANDTAKPVETLVAFPLPDIDNNEYTEVPLGAITNDPVNFVGFGVTVGGRKVPFAIEQRAFYQGRDVTRLLDELGAPLNVVAGENYKTLDALAGKARKALLAADLADEEGEGHLHPHWTVKTKFYWTQRFAARSRVVIEHSYLPVTGGALFGDTEINPGPDATYFPAREYCIDPATMERARALLKTRRAKDDGTGLLTALTTDYILTTARNWQGPIGRFHLTLDKLKAENVLSLCWEGELKKTGATTFEANIKDFVPKNDIHLLVLQQ